MLQYILSGKDEKEYHKNLQDMLRLIQNYGLKVKFSKCKFFVEQVKYLGYVTNQDGLQRISGITQMKNHQIYQNCHLLLEHLIFMGNLLAI